jgi:DNA-binding FadR family transcriptional regulator
MAALRRTKEDLAGMRSCLDEARKVMNDLNQFLQLDQEFHQMIAVASHNQIAVTINSVVLPIVQKNCG